MLFCFRTAIKTLQLYGGRELSTSLLVTLGGREGSSDVAVRCKGRNDFEKRRADELEAPGDSQY